MEQTISLNAIRVFATVARTHGITRAAAELGVTPSAVSHQIRTLEDRLGVPLLDRSGNRFQLSAEGQLLFQRAQPGLGILNSATRDIVRSAQEMTVTVATSLATRWLIPRLDEFRGRHPSARIRIETHSGPGNPQPTDVSITYHRGDPMEDAEVLLWDFSLPLIAPQLLKHVKDPTNLFEIPALQCTASNWDWDAYLAAIGASGVALNYAAQFDLDDSALRAAVAGMGMVLSPVFMASGEIAEGRLCPLPHATAVPLGCYILQVNRDTGLTNNFCNWLQRISQ